MKITVITPGMGRETNPYTKHVPGYPEQLYEVWTEFEAEVKTFDALDQQGNKLSPGEYDVELVWQFRHTPICKWLKSTVRDEFETFKQYAEDNPNIETRQIYQSSTPQPNKGETVEEAARLYNETEVRYFAVRFARQSRINQDVTSNDTITSFDKWFNPANWKQSQGLVSVEAVVTLIDSVPGLFKNSAYKLNLIEQIKNLNK